ncbi:MAG: glycosyltransferase [Alphaproteobacteria bacterium]|nr:glycosyltransferase [Alphaproteobacteria bacterium]
MPFDFLLTSWGNPGNLNPMLTAARRLRQRGHSVRMLDEVAHREEIEQAGFYALSWRRPAPIRASESNGEEPVWAEFRLLMDQLIFGAALDYAADTIDALRDEAADVVVTNDLLAGPAIAAEALGIPCALLSPHISFRPLEGVPFSMDGMPPDSAERLAAQQADITRFVALQNSYLTTLNRGRAAFGLGPLRHIHDHYDRADRVLIAMSAGFDFPAACLPRNYRYVGPLLDMPAWIQPWTPPWRADRVRPRVLVSLSTSFQNQADMLRRIITALGTLNLDAVVTTGPAMQQERFSAPDNVTILAAVSHDAVMRDVSLVVTHGGHGTVARALLNQVPLLVIPMGRDQGSNALRVAARGAGLTLGTEATEVDIAAAVARLLVEPNFRQAAMRLGQEMALDMASPVLASELEEIAARSHVRLQA